VREGRLLAIAASLAAVAMLAGCGGGNNGGAIVSGVERPDNHGYLGTYLDPPYTVPDIALTDTSGHQVSLATQPARLKVVFFGYTHCPDVCQIMMSTIASALIRIPSAERAAVQVTFVTTDPARDTGPVLRAYLDHFNSRFAGLTGPLPTIMRLAGQLKVYLAKGTKLASGGYEVEHTTYVFAIVGTGATVIWNQGTSPADMAADITKLLKTKESA
jgi:protein SCO1/2